MIYSLRTLKSKLETFLDNWKDFYNDYSDEMVAAGIYSVVGAYFLIEFVLDTNGALTPGGVGFRGRLGIYGVAIAVAIAIVWLIRNSDIKNHITFLGRIERLDRIEVFAGVGLIAFVIVLSLSIYFSFE